MNKTRLATVLLLSGLITTNIYATNGYFSHGYGTKSKGLAGSGSALPQDAMASAVNPAGMVWVGERMDLGVAIFSPMREYTVSGDAPDDPPPSFDLSLGTVESDSEYFLVPHFAYNWMLDDDSSVGLAVYGNGGMNTDYPGSANNGMGTYYGGMVPGAKANAGIDLMQLFINVSYSHKISNSASWGVSLVTAYQRFEATGLAAFGGYSSDPMSLTDNDYDDGFGFGGKFGVQAEISEGLTLAASYQTEISMDEFSDYSGLFAEQGGFDIPANWTMGLAYNLGSSGTLTFDIQEILYSDIASINNPFLPNIMMAPLGADGGAGFGFEDMMVYKAGYQWSSSDSMVWRLGFSTGDQPIPESEVLFNILAPAVMEEHFTFGFTYNMSDDSEFNFAAMYAPSNSISGPNFLSGGEVSGPMPDQNIEIEMTQWELEASWAWKF